MSLLFMLCLAPSFICASDNEMVQENIAPYQLAHHSMQANDIALMQRYTSTEPAFQGRYSNGLHQCVEHPYTCVPRSSREASFCTVGLFCGAIIAFISLG